MPLGSPATNPIISTQLNVLAPFQADPFCGRLLLAPNAVSIYEAFFCLALSAFFRLLLIITTERKLPTTVVPKMRRMTGMRMAQTRGRKSEWRMWSSSTKGCIESVCVPGRNDHTKAYHEQSPDSVVDEDGSRCDEHAEAYEAIGL